MMFRKLWVEATAFLISTSQNSKRVSAVMHISLDYSVCLLTHVQIFAELEALGDELSADTDTSYLDDAVNAPSVPSREPGESVNAVSNRVEHTKVLFTKL